MRPAHAARAPDLRIHFLMEALDRMTDRFSQLIATIAGWWPVEHQVDRERDDERNNHCGFGNAPLTVRILSRRRALRTLLVGSLSLVLEI
jgi:hypothetical protein